MITVIFINFFKSFFLKSKSSNCVDNKSDCARVKDKRRRLSEISSTAYWIRVWQKRICRMLIWSLNYKNYVNENNRAGEKILPYRYAYHRSKLMKKYGEDPQYILWQMNKITNLRLAIERINGIIIPSKKSMSFCKLVGFPSKKRGFVEGMELSRGKAQSGIGGGICQLSNLLNWLAWHTPLEVIERSLHSFDPFPDDNRVLPFGSGAAIFWNYVDWQVKNNTEQDFQIRVWIDRDLLKGEIRCEKKPEKKYSIFEKNHFFCKKEGDWYRSNEIWRRVFIKNHDGQGKFLEREEMMVRNWSLVCYEPKIDKYEVRIWEE